MNRTRRTILLSAAALPFARVHAKANFPSRPIRFIIAFPSGSASDVLARHLGDKIAASLGQPVIIESKPGAQGVIAVRSVITSENDGHTIFLGSNTSHAANVHLVKNLSYDPIKDFTAISQYTINPLLLVVRGDLPIHTVQDLIQYAKARPGALNYGTGNTGGLIAAHLLRSKTGIDAMGINYSGTAQAITDLVGGRLEFMVVDYMIIRPFMETGQIRVLGVSSKQRLPSLPDIPSLSEAGIPDYDYASWTGIFAPANLPTEVTQKLNTAINQALAEKSTHDFLANLGVIAAPSGAEEFEAFIKAQIDDWGRLSKDAGLTAV